MAKRKIVWSHRAQIKLYDILKYFIDRNKNKTYSEKLYRKINKELKLLVKHPDLGINTDFEFVRALIIDVYIIFYECSENVIIIHTIWDSRQDPNNLVIK